ncbi:MAG: G patch domain-containing 8-like [Trebouxia sp. A1-2]|nr:MAG: G patch domain-containing 8-like [Trebouxia sp. A1-2]
MQAFPQFTVVDSRLQAGRGEEFSASRQKEKEQLAHAQQSYDDAEPWHLPIGHRPQDSLDTEGLAMASTDTAIPEDNRGYRMLQRMGWKGTGLGRNENGIVEPVKGGVEAGLRLGVGKAEQDTFYMAADNVVRKKLEVELQADEDQSRRDRREMQAERDERIRQDVTTMQRTFYCQTCSKQYKNAAEMEAHMSSYDHHHKKRLIEMRVDEAERTRGVRDKKEKKRADKEMARYKLLRQLLHQLLHQMPHHLLLQRQHRPCHPYPEEDAQSSPPKIHTPTKKKSTLSTREPLMSLMAAAQLAAQGKTLAQTPETHITALGPAPAPPPLWVAGKQRPTLELAL